MLIYMVGSGDTLAHVLWCRHFVFRLAVNYDADF